MRSLRGIAAGLLLIASVSIFDVATAADIAPVIYRGATLIDGTGAAPKPDMAIITRGERIEAVMPSAALTKATLATARIVDTHGLYEIPGLIDSHVHLATPPDRKYALAHLRRDIYSGITTVRDMAGDTRFLADLSRAARQSEIESPDIYYAALMAGPEFFNDPRAAASAAGAIPGEVPWLRAVTEHTNLALAVAEAHGTGATGVKIYADLSPVLVRNITAEAHRQHMLAWAHGAVFPASPREVVDAGVDVMSHVCLLAYQASKTIPAAYHDRPSVEEQRFKTRNAAVQGVFEQMKARGTILDATLYVYDAMWKVPNAQPKPYCHLDLAEKLAAEAHRIGVLTSAGTDAPADWKSPFPSLYDELELLVEHAGFTPADALMASSRVGAMTVGRVGEVGTIEPGKLADIVFTAKNPLANIRNLRTITMTVKHGKAYPRAGYKPITREEVGEE